MYHKCTWFITAWEIFNVKNRSAKYIHMLFEVLSELLKYWRKKLIDRREEEKSTVPWALKVSFTIVMSLKMIELWYCTCFFNSCRSVNTKFISLSSFLCSVLCNLELAAEGAANTPTKVMKELICIQSFNAPVLICNPGQERHAWQKSSFEWKPSSVTAQILTEANKRLDLEKRVESSNSVSKVCRTRGEIMMETAFCPSWKGEVLRKCSFPQK